MFMSQKDLPLYGRVLAWAIAIGAWASIVLGFLAGGIAISMYAIDFFGGLHM